MHSAPCTLQRLFSSCPAQHRPELIAKLSLLLILRTWRKNKTNLHAFDDTRLTPPGTAAVDRKALLKYKVSEALGRITRLIHRIRQVKKYPISEPHAECSSRATEQPRHPTQAAQIQPRCHFASTINIFISAKNSLQKLNEVAIHTYLADI